MAYTVILLPEAEQDLDEAIAWYERQQKGLGQRFYDRVQECLRGLAQTPQMHACVLGTRRRALVKRFPYSIFYEVRE